MAKMQSQLHIPQGIRFQCTACGHCCHEYPVPLTEDDVIRLRSAEGALADQSISLLSPAERSQSGLVGFSYSLDKHVGGNCSFLTEAKKCRVHDVAKPAMCKLFPYTFVHCPDGLKVGLSFASTGVLLNSGERLLDQEPMLADLRDLFDTMHPDLAKSSLEKWSRSEFVAGAPLDYADFKDFNEPYLSRLEKLIAMPAGQRASTSGDCAQTVLSDMFDVLIKSLPIDMLSPLSKRFPDRSADKLDHYILMPLYRAYFNAAEPVREDEIALAVMTYLSNEERDLYFVAGEKKVTLADLSHVKIDPLTDLEQDLINRFVYVRLFARLYFGPGFSMLPLLSGIFHLTSVVVLVSMALKMDSLALKINSPSEPGAPASGQSPSKFVDAGVRFDRVLSLVREIDRRLTAVVYSRNTCSMFELFALDPERVRRFLVSAN
jgi:Fe-S-cluster containining protein